jgi:hypothetical protein
MAASTIKLLKGAGQLMRITVVPLGALLLALPILAQSVHGNAPAPKSWTKPPVTIEDLHIAQRAADILSSPEKWNRADTDKCPAEATTFSLYCTLQVASQEVRGKEDSDNAVMQEARITVDLMAPKKYGSRLADYNNDPATSFQDVQEFFRILKNRLSRRMAEEAPGATLTARGEDGSQSRSSVTEADVRIVRRAKSILDSPIKWNREDSRVCPPEAKTFSLYCALEKATHELSGKFEHRGAAMQEARFVIEDIAPNAPYYDHRLMDFNNDSSTTFFDIQKFFQLLEDRITKQLAARNTH